MSNQTLFDSEVWILQRIVGFKLMKNIVGIVETAKLIFALNMTLKSKKVMRFILTCFSIDKNSDNR